MFVAVAVFTVGAAAAIFFQKSLMRSVMSLTLSFTGSAVIFYIIGQNVLALIQLLVFVGGLSTYLIVAVSSENREPRRTGAFVALAVFLSIGLSVALLAPMAITQGAGNFANYASSAFNSYYALLYVIALALFGAAMASVLVIRRFVRLIV